MKHSPLPWVVHPTEEPVAIMSGDVYVATCHFCPGWDAAQIGNADLICRAVNSHNELVEALERMLKWCGSDERSIASMEFRARAEARAALAKAKGSQ